MDPQAAITPIPIESVHKDTHNTIKNLAIKSNPKQQYVIITKCLCDPCPIFYTDTISESFLIECKDPQHNNHQNQELLENNNNNQVEKGKFTKPTHNLNQQPMVATPLIQESDAHVY